MADPGFIRRKGLERGGYRNLPRLEIKPFGNWSGVMRTMARLSPAIKQSSIAAQMKVAKQIVKIVKAHLRNQDLGWRPLAPTTVELKETYGLDSRILYAHGGYYDAIEAWQKNQESIVFAGVKKGKYARSYQGKKRRIDISQVAAIHEFSRGKRIPRRPLWNPTIREMGGAKGIQKMFINSFVWHLRRAGIPITNDLKNPFK
jgi:hypothetical protein